LTRGTRDSDGILNNKSTLSLALSYYFAVHTHTHTHTRTHTHTHTHAHTHTQVTAMEHSIANTLKRPLTLVASCLTFGTRVSRETVLGSALGVLGAALYVGSQK
jgi:drug/metabolite transporter (DMT)-like permease